VAYQQDDRASTTRYSARKSRDAGFGAVEKQPESGKKSAPSGQVIEGQSSTIGETEHLEQSSAPLDQASMRTTQSGNRRRPQTGGMNGDGTSSPKRFAQLASPATPTPLNKGYFVFPKNVNVVVLYNKKAVANALYQFSSGTAMGEQGLRMLQDYSGSTLNPRLIDISDPGWVRKLEALAAKNKGGFTHLVIIDHGSPGNQQFGGGSGSSQTETALTPESAAWRIISSVMAPNGHIHLAGCYVARRQEGQDYLNALLRSLGKGSKITIDAVTGSMFNQANQFEGNLIQAQPIP